MLVANPASNWRGAARLLANAFEQKNVFVKPSNLYESLDAHFIGGKESYDSNS